MNKRAKRRKKKRKEEQIVCVPKICLFNKIFSKPSHHHKSLTCFSISYHALVLTLRYNNKYDNLLSKILEN